MPRFFVLSVMGLLLPTLAGADGQALPAAVAANRAIVVEKQGETSVTLLAKVPSLKPREIETVAGKFLKFEETGAVTLKEGEVNLSLAEIPMMSAIVALPVGAKPENIVLESVGIAASLKGRLYPVQKTVRASAEGDDKFEFQFDKAKYLKSGANVKQIASIEQIEDAGANLFRITFPVADFDPVKESITLHKGVKIFVKYPMLEKCYRLIKRDKRIAQDPVELALEGRMGPIALTAANAELVEKQVCFKDVVLERWGARFLIISHPEFLNAANTLRAHKISRGLSTMVKSTQEIAQTYGNGSLTPAAIKAYLKYAHENFINAPKWVLFMGDAEFIPTHYSSQTNTYDSAKNAGDIYYGQLYQNDLSIPVFGMGRIPVDTLAQANDVVAKIVAYESNPATDKRFYKDFTFAAQFQDDDNDGDEDRKFALTSERIREYMVSNGFDVERIYSASVNTSPTVWGDGSSIPNALRRPTFPWDGNTGDVIAATNAGTNILYHRDHGWWYGWGTPDFSTSDLSSVQVPAKQNPIVFSINCASGIFDNETVDHPSVKVGSGYGPSASSVYWAEEFLRKTDGALAIIGDTRSSNTNLNNSMARGLFDSMFASFDTNFGGQQSTRRLGDVLNHAKAYVKAQGFSDESVRQEIKIYNLLGDPTLDFRSSPPRFVRFDFVNYAIEQKRLRLRVTLTEALCDSCSVSSKEAAQSIAVLQDSKGNVLGRALLNEKGEAEIKLTTAVQGEALVTVAGANLKTASHKVMIP